MGKFNFIMFDLDGTILNTLEDLADAVNKALADNGFGGHLYADYRNIIGKGAYNLITQSLPESARQKDIIDKVHSEFSAIYAENCAVKTHVYDGIIEALMLIEKTGIEMAVLSNKPDRYMEDIKNMYFPEINFKAFRGKLDGVAGKPDPEGVELVAREIGVSLENAIYIGDSSVDMETAKNTGMFACGVLWGFRSKSELVEYGADILVETPAMLAEYILANV